MNPLHSKQHLISELQSQGLRLIAQDGVAGRRGGAGPSDHKAITLDGTTVMVPIYTDAAASSPYTARIDPATTTGVLMYEGESIFPVSFPRQPEFYGLKTVDGIPYWQIALLHSRDVLATTVLQSCVRYASATEACQFCAIGQSLEAGRTIARKTPAQLGEVAEAAVRLDRVKHMVMTTGTPTTSDRGAAYLAECARAVKGRVALPIQAQCEPPEDFYWFDRLQAAGVDSLGMHLEVVTPEIRRQVMPGKATVPVDFYFEAFAAAVGVFGTGQVSTYLLAGLGDSQAVLLETCERLIHLGVYPFVVPFVPITGTPLAHLGGPDSAFMYVLYQQVARLLQSAGMSATAIKAGCGRCGACSALSTFETTGA
ncbi:MAG: MSMEG_0568 family radical SAM protein [Gemmatimonadaceae bacterium]|nr:MSMEG_0568 family radical SAM protein [Gloeobacterales cyanobacterium ES-bin-141]